MHELQFWSDQRDYSSHAVQFVFTEQFLKRYRKSVETLCNFCLLLDLQNVSQKIEKKYCGFYVSAACDSYTIRSCKHRGKALWDWIWLLKMIWTNLKIICVEWYTHKTGAIKSGFTSHQVDHFQAIPENRIYIYKIFTFNICKRQIYFAIRDNWMFTSFIRLYMW